MPGAARRRSARAARAQGAVVAAFVAVVLTACTTTVDGWAARERPGPDDDSRSPVDVDAVLLEQVRMRAITGGGDHLTVIPSMDGKVPVDIDVLAIAAPEPCRWYFAETQTFGTDLEDDEDDAPAAFALGETA